MDKEKFMQSLKDGFNVDDENKLEEIFSLFKRIEDNNDSEINVLKLN